MGSQLMLAPDGAKQSTHCGQLGLYLFAWPGFLCFQLAVTAGSMGLTALRDMDNAVGF